MTERIGNTIYTRQRVTVLREVPQWTPPGQPCGAWARGRAMSKQVTLQEPELFWLLLGNVRYAMGRMSMAPTIAQDAVRKYAHALKPHQIAQIGKEVREELRLCNERRAKDGYLADLAREAEGAIDAADQSGMGWWLGMEMDHRAWEDFAAWCERQAESSNEP